MWSPFALPLTRIAGGGNTARRILSHTYALPRDNAVCRDVYKFIARMAHPDKNLTRDAYHCTMAGIIMDTAQRASDTVANDVIRPVIKSAGARRRLRSWEAV